MGDTAVWGQGHDMVGCMEGMGHTAGTGDTAGMILNVPGQGRVSLLVHQRIGIIILRNSAEHCKGHFQIALALAFC